MPLLEALTVFNDLESSWPSEYRQPLKQELKVSFASSSVRRRRTYVNKAYGACIVATMRGLKMDGRLDTTNFPALETLLKSAAEWGEAMKGMGCDSPYYKFCKAIGKRFFKDKSDEAIALEKACVEEWVTSLNEAEQEGVRASMKEDEEAAAEGHVEKPWYAGDEDDKDEDYAMSRVWKEYKDYLAECPTMHLRGPMNWDISEWTAAEKKEFLFDNMDI
jgi:hypothetical protein